MGTVTQLLSRSPESGSSNLSAEHAQILRTYADLVVRAASLGGQVMINDKYQLSLNPTPRLVAPEIPAAEAGVPVQAVVPEQQAAADIIPIDRASQIPTDLEGKQDRIAAAQAARDEALKLEAA